MQGSFSAGILPLQSEGILPLWIEMSETYIAEAMSWSNASGQTKT